MTYRILFSCQKRNNNFLIGTAQIKRFIYTFKVKSIICYIQENSLTSYSSIKWILKCREIENIENVFLIHHRHNIKWASGNLTKYKKLQARGKIAINKKKLLLYKIIFRVYFIINHSL